MVETSLVAGDFRKPSPRSYSLFLAEPSVNLTGSEENSMEHPDAILATPSNRSTQKGR